MIALAAIALIGSLLVRHGGKRLFCAGLALILGGALGNLIDRMRSGTWSTSSLLHAGGWHWPAFNVADSAITVGAVLLILDGLLGKRVKGPG